MDIIEFQKRWIMRYINPIFFYLPFQSCQVNEIGFNIKVLLWNTYNPIKDEYKNRLFRCEISEQRQIKAFDYRGHPPGDHPPGGGD